MGIRVTDSIRKRIFVALLAAGVSAPSAYVATTHTVKYEGFETVPYNDPVGLKTYCIGHLAKKGEVVKKEYTLDECIQTFVKDWVEHERQYVSKVKVPFKSEWMKASGSDFTFHMGITSVASSTYLKDLNAKHYDMACEQLTRWVYGRVNGVMTKMPGLVLRATDRYKYCMGDIPATYQSDMIRWTGGTLNETKDNP